jgi:hypothetical protein
MLKIKEMKSLKDNSRERFVCEFCFIDMFKKNAYFKMLELLSGY